MSLGEKLAERRYSAARKRVSKMTVSEIDDQLNLLKCPEALRDEIIERLAELENRR
jgi:hypothetical protein